MSTTGEDLKFEIVRTEAGYHARVKTRRNGKIRLSSEVVARPQTAEKILTDCFGTNATLVHVDRRGRAL